MAYRNQKFLVPAVLAGILAISVQPVSAAPITATWNGSSGSDWNDGANWNFSTPPITANFPNNDANDTFNVLIDGGTLGNSTTNLNVNATIDTLNVSTGDTLNFNNTRDLTIAGGSIVNNGAINLNGTTSGTVLGNLGSTTISGTGTLTLGNSTHNVISTSGGTTLTNAAGHTIQGGGSILSNVGDLNNQGTISATTATPLVIDAATTVTNTGTLRADGGTLDLRAATYTNTGGTIEAINSGIVNLNSGLMTINGGTLTSATGGEIRSSVGGGPILNNVTLAAGTVFRQTNTTDSRIQGGIVNNGTWNLDGSTSQTLINFEGSQTLSGTGEIVMTDSTHNQIRVDIGEVLTVGSGQTIRGTGHFGLNTGGFVLDGTLLQQGSTVMSVDPGAADAGGGANMVINGTFRAEGSGGINIGSGIYQNNSTIQANAGSSINLFTAAAEIRGGNLTTVGTGEIVSSAGGGAILDGVTVTAGSTVRQSNSHDLRIRNGITFDGTWNINASTSQTDIIFDGSQTIDASAGNTGIINLADSIHSRILTGVGEVVTLGSRMTVQGAGTLLSNTGGFIQDGDIIQQGTTALTIDPGAADAGGGANYIVNGILRAEGIGGINLGSGIFDNNSNIQANAGSVINLAATTEIIGGSLTSIGSGEILSAVGTGAILDGVTVTAGSTLRQSNTHDIRVRNGITFDGTWNVEGSSSSTDITLLGSQTIDASAGNTGTINFTDSIHNRILTGVGEVVTLGSRMTLQGAGTILTNTGGFIQDGDIIQQGTTALTIDPGAADAGGGANYIINGVLRAEGIGGINLGSGIFDNNSNIQANAGSVINLAATTEIIGGSLTSIGSGEILSAVGAGAILDGVTVTTGSTLRQSNTHDIRVRNGITMNGDWNLNGVSSTTDINAINSLTIGGTGNINFSDSIHNRIITGVGNTVTQGAGITLSGGGQILTGSGGYVNQGTIDANGTTRLLLQAGAGGFAQQGTLQASGAGGIDVQNGAFFTQASGLTDVQTGSRLDVLTGNYVQTGGTTNVNGILTTAASFSTLELQGGRLEGTGTIDFNGSGTHAVNNTGGTLAAGNSPGILTITDGDYLQAASANFEYELFGATVGIDHDLLSIMSGNADLAGSLSVVTDFAFADTLTIGDQFEVIRLDTGSFIGVDFLDQVFDSININIAGIAFDQLFIGNSLFIEVTQADAINPVSEPAPALLMLAGTAMLLGLRRRRNRLQAAA